MWIAPEMAGVSARGEEKRFEAQGYGTPEDFCAAVTECAATQVWSPPYPQPQGGSLEDANWLLITIGVLITLILAWLIVRPH